MKKISLFLYFATLSLLFLHPINSGDFFHHLNTGRHVFQHFSLPYTDDLSFTAYGKPWIAHSWGAGLLFYSIYSLFGPNGISIFFAFLGGATAFFLFLTLRNLKTNLITSLVLTLLTTTIIALRWPLRPEVFAAFFVSILLFLLSGKKHGSYWLTLFFWLWGIIYGSSVFLGLGIYALFLIVNKYLTRRSLLLFGLCVIASLLNGYGFASFFYIFRIPDIAPHVGEWLPLIKTLNPKQPDLMLFYQYIVLAYFLFLAFSVVLVAFSLIKNKHLLWKNLFFTVLFLSLFIPFISIRSINLAPVLASPFLALIAQQVNNTMKRFIGMLTLALVGFNVFVLWKIFPLQLGIQKDIFPVAVTTFLRSNGVSGNIFANQEIGAFLSAELPQSKVFVDTRDDLYIPLGIFTELRSLSEGKMSLLSLLEKYNADIVVGDLGSGAVYAPLFYNPQWSLVFLTDGYFISVKKDITQAHQLKPYESLDPVRIVPSKPGELAGAKESLTYLLQLYPQSEENKIRLIEVLLAQNKPAEAKNRMNAVAFSGQFGARTPLIQMDSHIMKGRVYLANQECDEAFSELSRAEKLSYGQFLFYLTLRLPTAVDRYLGEYYLSCENDRMKGREYLLRYLQGTSNSIERRQIERKMEKMQ